MFNKKHLDIVAEKEAKLTQLTQEATNAVDLVTRTISGLELVNQEIEDTVADIDAYSERLDKTRGALEQSRNNNAAIIANFSKLLSVE